MRAFPTKLDNITVEKTRINPIFTENELSKISHALLCRRNVALLKFPDVLKEWTVALNQKEDISFSRRRSNQKGFLCFPNKGVTIWVRVRE